MQADGTHDGGDMGVLYGCRRDAAETESSMEMEIKMRMEMEMRMEICMFMGWDEMD